MDGLALQGRLWPRRQPARSHMGPGVTLGAFPWVTPEVRRTVELLPDVQTAEYIRLVRHQHRADLRERAHTLTECGLPAAAAIHDARVARSHVGAGGGHRRGAGRTGGMTRDGGA
jgi:hypothetical protein